MLGGQLGLDVRRLLFLRVAEPHIRKPLGVLALDTLFTRLLGGFGCPFAYHFADVPLAELAVVVA